MSCMPGKEGGRKGVRGEGRERGREEGKEDVSKHGLAGTYRERGVWKVKQKNRGIGIEG